MACFTDYLKIIIDDLEKEIGLKNLTKERLVDPVKILMYEFLSEYSLETNPIKLNRDLVIKIEDSILMILVNEGDETHQLACEIPN